MDLEGLLVVGSVAITRRGSSVVAEPPRIVNRSKDDTI
jgi:hypothetical protein